MTPLLPARLLARLERLQLGTRRPLIGGLVGEHRSPRFGASLDFTDYRQYHPGDDLRRLDVNAYARLDRLMLKLFEAEDDLNVRLLVDTSASMEGAKLARAKELAAALGFVALTNRDVVTLHAFPMGVPAGTGHSARWLNESPRHLGRSGVPALFARLDALEPGGDTPFAEAALRLLSRPGPPGVTVVISDLLTDEWSTGLRRLPAAAGEVAVIHVLDPDDLRPDLTGDLELVDRETGAVVEVSVTPAAAEEYARLVEAWQADVAGQARRLGAGYSMVLTTDDLERVVFGALGRAGTVG